MKVAMLFPLHSLCFLTLLVFNTLQPLVATAEEEILEPVYDIQGEPVRPGESYYVWPLGADNGGLTLSSIRSKTCPLYVIRDPSHRSTPMFFDVWTDESPLDYIPTFTDLTVTGLVIGPCLNDSRVWELSKVGPPETTPSLFFVRANGTAGTISTLFKIEKPVGCDLSCHIYYFKFCPSNLPFKPRCGPLGTYVDADGTKILALGDAIEPFYVRFQKVPINHPPTKINQGGLSIV